MKAPCDVAFWIGIHHCSFRAGTPAVIVGVRVHIVDNEQVPCFEICFPDGQSDFVSISDVANYRIISGDDVKGKRIPKVSL